MNNKVDETTEVTATEAAEGGIAGQKGTHAAEASAAVDTRENPVTADTENSSKHRGGSRNWRIILFLTILLAVTASAAGYLYFDLSAGRKTNEAQLQSLAARLDALQQSHAYLTADTRALDERLTGINEQFTGMLHNLNSLYQHRNSDINWQLAELKYLFHIASQRLVLARDVDTAQAILQAADSRLMGIADPALIPVRKQLIADINRLKPAQRLDYTGLALTLSGLAERAGLLPLNLGGKGEQGPQPNANNPNAMDNRWQRLARSVWQELKSLVVISRTDNNTAALLAPQERYFLYQNLRLQLEMSRLALLLRDEAQYRISINTSTDWLNEYFDTADERVRTALASLENAGSVDFYEPVLSIDMTLNAFDKYLARTKGPLIGGGVQQ